MQRNGSARIIFPRMAQIFFADERGTLQPIFNEDKEQVYHEHALHAVTTV